MNDSKLLQYGGIIVGPILLYLSATKADSPYMIRGLLALAGVGALTLAAKELLLKGHEEGWLGEQLDGIAEQFED